MKLPKIDLCCSSDALRPSMMYVCVKKDYTYASEGHVLVRHNTEEIFKEDFYSTLPESGIMIHVNAFKLMRQNKTSRISLSEDRKVINLHQTDNSTISYNCQPDFSHPAPTYAYPDRNECKPLTEIAINARLLFRLSEAMGSPLYVLKMMFYGTEKNIYCDTNKEGDYYSAIGIIMPAMMH